MLSRTRTIRTLFVASSKDGAIVLDMKGKTGRCKTGHLFKFSPTGLEMWRLLCCGNPEDAVIEVMTAKYGIKEDRAAQGLANLLRDAQRMGLSPEATCLHEAPHSEAHESLTSFPWYAQDGNAVHPKPTTAMVLLALVGLVLFDLLLSVQPMEVMCAIVKRWPLRLGRIHNDKSTLIGSICMAVEKACIWYPKNALCLQRSAVTACMLRSWGITGEMVLAARPMPLMAHAWVEVEGAVVNDRPQVKSFYHKLTAF